MRELWEDLCAQEEDTDNDSDHQYVCEYLVCNNGSIILIIISYFFLKLQGVRSRQPVGHRPSAFFWRRKGFALLHIPPNNAQLFFCNQCKTQSVQKHINTPTHTQTHKEGDAFEWSKDIGTCPCAGFCQVSTNTNTHTDRHIKLSPDFCQVSKVSK